MFLAGCPRRLPLPRSTAGANSAAPPSADVRSGFGEDGLPALCPFGSRHGPIFQCGPAYSRVYVVRT